MTVDPGTPTSRDPSAPNGSRLIPDDTARARADEADGRDPLPDAEIRDGVRVAPDVPVIVDNASRTYGDVVALDGVSFEVPRGTILGLIGPSGSGKTTTLRLLTGAIDPTQGTVRVLGEDPRRFHGRTRERIGYSPQLFVLYQDLTAGENVDFVGALFGMLVRRRRRRVREVLELVELWDARKRRASQLSGGMQRRLELACALVHEPELLFLDEPTAGIDPILRQTIWDELRRLRDDGRTLLVTTQYVGEAEYCDRVALIAGGRLIAFGSSEELRREAVGGEVIEVQTERAFDAPSIPAVAGVTHIRQQGPRELLVYAEDAGGAMPRVIDAIESTGGRVVSSSEYRPTFDEVFAELVARDDRLRQGDTSTEAA
jgi:ABC-2 type transport system ATP-binding protein